MQTDELLLPDCAPAWGRAAYDRILTGRPTAIDLLWLDPARVMTEAGFPAVDDFQRGVISSTAGRVLMLCARQIGKSQTAAAVALLTALREPGSLILLLSPSQRQSGELFRDKLLRLYNAHWRNVVPPVQESALTMELANGSRIVSLPGTPDTVVGYSNVALLVIDEAARVDDSLYRLTRPMLAVSRGRLLALSTPKGRRGWFFEEWSGANGGGEGGGSWEKYTVAAGQCLRISAQFLAEERASMGALFYAQEYECQFNEASGAVFSQADLAKMVSGDVEPLAI